MVEVLFGESEAASMKAAKSTVLISHTDGPVSVWAAGKKKPPERPFTGWVQGTAEEVICLNFMLDIGDISEPIDSIYRKDFICEMYLQEQWGTGSEMESELRNAVDCYANEIKRLENYLKENETVRVWYSNAPYSMCGFYQLCQMLLKYDNEILAVKLPEHKVCENFIVSYQNWGEVAAEEFAGFLPQEKVVSREELRLYAGLWNELQEDNSPLRTVINGKVMGAPENFYDYLIWKKLGKEPVKEARLIGDILGYYPISVGVWWYAKRIDFYIEQGWIKVTEDSEKKYARMICLAQK